MKRVLKNLTVSTILTNSHGNMYQVDPKGTLTIDHPKADAIAQDLLTRYGFLRDVTPKEVPVVETKTVIEPNQKGKMRPVVKKVVKQGRGVRK